MRGDRRKTMYYVESHHNQSQHHQLNRSSPLRTTRIGSPAACTRCTAGSGHLHHLPCTPPPLVLDQPPKLGESGTNPRSIIDFLRVKPFTSRRLPRLLQDTPKMPTKTSTTSTSSAWMAPFVSTAAALLALLVLLCSIVMAAAQVAGTERRPPTYGPAAAAGGATPMRPGSPLLGQKARQVVFCKYCTE